jgi:hypothetical protein
LAKSCPNFKLSEAFVELKLLLHSHGVSDKIGAYSRAAEEIYGCTKVALGERRVEPPADLCIVLEWIIVRLQRKEEGVGDGCTLAQIFLAAEQVNDFAYAGSRGCVPDEPAEDKRSVAVSPVIRGN